MLYTCLMCGEMNPNDIGGKVDDLPQVHLSFRCSFTKLMHQLINSLVRGSERHLLFEVRACTMSHVDTGGKSVVCVSLSLSLSLCVSLRSSLSGVMCVNF